MHIAWIFWALTKDFDDIFEMDPTSRMTKISATADA